MNISPEAILFLAGKGLSMEELAEFVRLSEQRKDPTAAERQRKSRANKRSKRHGVTVTRDPLIEEDHIPGSHISSSDENENVTPAAKPEAFPCPDDCDPLDWQGLLANRKNARKPMTASAYRTICKKLTDWQRAGWPPGPIVANAAERGWQTVFETDEMKAPQHGRSNQVIPIRGNAGDDRRSSLARAADEGIEWLSG